MPVTLSLHFHKELYEVNLCDVLPQTTYVAFAKCNMIYYYKFSIKAI